MQGPVALERLYKGEAHSRLGLYLALIFISFLSSEGPLPNSGRSFVGWQQLNVVMKICNWAAWAEPVFCNHIQAVMNEAKQA